MCTIPLALSVFIQYRAVIPSMRIVHTHTKPSRIQKNPSEVLSFDNYRHTNTFKVKLEPPHKRYTIKDKATPSKAKEKRGRERKSSTLAIDSKPNTKITRIHKSLEQWEAPMAEMY